VLVVAFFALLVLLLATPGRAQAQSTATKSCTPTGTNLYTCTLTITPAVATGSGVWLVQMVTPGPGAFASTPAVAASPGCNVAPSVAAPGSLISSSFGNADYDVVVGTGGCSATATVTITEIVAVTASGQVCQRVWVTTGSPYTTACDTVVYTPPSPSADKACSLTSISNVYTCTFTITPSIATGPGAWLVQMVTPGPGAITSTPVVSTATTGCNVLPAITAPGSLISPIFGNADYDLVVGPGGCNANAVVVITETVTVTASGQVCQRVWITAGFPSVTACDTVVYTPQPGVAIAAKTCTLTSTPNVYTCSFIVTPAFPAIPGDILHINEAPGPAMTGPGTISATPTVGTHGCPETPSPVVMSSSTSYNAQIGASGCIGTTWSVEFIETITVTASGEICQSFYMVATVGPATACTTVEFAKSLPGTPAPGKFSGTIAPSGMSLVNFGGGSVAILSAAATAEGARSVWRPVNGRLTGYILGAPDFVNARFNVVFSGGVPSGPLILVMPPRRL